MFNNHEENIPEKEKAAPTTKTALPKSQTKHSGNSAFAQRLRLLDALRKRPMSTIEIRRELDILGVAQRIMELRCRGYRIDRNWIDVATDCGKLHRVALYALLGTVS